MALIDEFLLGMLEESGSDLHMMAGQAPRVRVYGRLASLDLPPIPAVTLGALLQEICPPERWQDYLRRRDLDFAYELSGTARFRCNYLFDQYGMAAVFRHIPSTIMTLAELRLPEVLEDICEFSHGLVLVTGPTGNGKSTTLAAMVDCINRTQCSKIVTVEDPLEFVHANRLSTILHREVGRHVKSFAEALRSAMKGDVDILLIGELRELETVRLALNCAAMGMLVFSTLHTNSAPKTIDRLVDVFPADEQSQIRALLAESFAAVVSQTLCRLADGSGRIAAHEVLLRTEALPNIIREGQSANVLTLLDAGAATGMCTMDNSLRALMEAGAISPAEAFMKASRKENFAVESRAWQAGRSRSARA